MPLLKLQVSHREQIQTVHPQLNYSATLHAQGTQIAVQIVNFGFLVCSSMFMVLARNL